MALREPSKKREILIEGFSEVSMNSGSEEYFYVENDSQSPIKDDLIIIDRKPSID